MNGYIAECTLIDGRCAAIELLTYGRGRIIAGNPLGWQFGYDEAW